LKVRGWQPVRREGTSDSGWLLIDYGSVVVHAFSEEQRGFYGLERLWGDAPELQFSEAEHAAAGS
jgi:ribosome-associated protein